MAEEGFLGKRWRIWLSSIDIRRLSQLSLRGIIGFRPQFTPRWPLLMLPHRAFHDHAQQRLLQGFALLG
jgi:hypothetical protein